MSDETKLRNPTPEEVEAYQRKYPQVYEVHQDSLQPEDITKAIMAFETLTQEEVFIHLIGLTLFRATVEAMLEGNAVFASLFRKKPAQA